VCIAKKCGPTADHKYAIFYYGSNHSRITYHLRDVFRVYTVTTV